MTVDFGQLWNHNIHYHRVILGAIPPGTQNALDVGCGIGLLARDLRQAVPRVTGIDTDVASIEQARTDPHTSGTEFVLGDFTTYPFEPESFDVVASVATLHHLDATTALKRMIEILRPGGTLAIVGLARTGIAGLPLTWLIGGIAHRFHLRTKTFWEHPSPKVWPPPESYRGMRMLARRLLPGARYRRHAMWRYSLVWRKPYPA